MKKTLSIGVFVALLVSLSLAAGNKKVSVANEAAKVKRAIQQYVQRDQQIKGGFFLRDPRSDIIRDLTFDHVDPYIEKTSDNQYVTCVDFTDRSNNRLDIDFYLKLDARGDLDIDRIEVHKVNGVDQNNP